MSSQADLVRRGHEESRLKSQRSSGRAHSIKFLDRFDVVGMILFFGYGISLGALALGFVARLNDVLSRSVGLCFL